MPMRLSSCNTDKFQFVGRLHTLLGLHFNATLQPNATRIENCVCCHEKGALQKRHFAARPFSFICHVAATVLPPLCLAQGGLLRGGGRKRGGKQERKRISGPSAGQRRPGCCRRPGAPRRRSHRSCRPAWGWSGGNRQRGWPSYRRTPAGRPS